MADDEKLTPKETLQGCLTLIVLVVIAILIIGLGLKACSPKSSDDRSVNATATANTSSGSDNSQSDNSSGDNAVSSEQADKPTPLTHIDIDSTATRIVDRCYSALRSAASSAPSMSGDEAMASLRDLMGTCSSASDQLNTTLAASVPSTDPGFMAQVLTSCSDSLTKLVASGTMRFQGAGGGVGVLNVSDYADWTQTFAPLADPHVCVGAVEENENGRGAATTGNTT